MDNEAIVARLVARIAEYKSQLKAAQMNGDASREFGLVVAIRDLEQILNGDE